MLKWITDFNDIIFTTDFSLITSSVQSNVLWNLKFKFF